MEERYKANSNYILRKIAGQHVLVSVGDAVADFCGVVTLNDSAKILWERLQEGATRTELAYALKDTFDVTDEQAENDVKETIRILKEREMIFNA